MLETCMSFEIGKTWNQVAILLGCLSQWASVSEPIRKRNHNTFFKALYKEKRDS